MKKKLQVFVSSTYIDLIEERQAAVEAILNAGHIPAGMELFQAGSETQKNTIQRWIDESDVYLLILGGRYGSIEPITDKSYTHWEYEYAGQAGKPRFAVVISDEALRIKGQQNIDFIERQNYAKYEEFKKEVLSHMSKFFNDSKDIKLAIQGALTEIMQLHPNLPGWVRGNDVSQIIKELEAQISTLKQEMEQRNSFGQPPTPRYIPVNPHKRIKGKYLKFLVSLYKATDGRQNSIVNMSELGSEIGFSGDETDKIAQFLKEEGLLKFVTIGGGISITHEGIVFMEDILEPLEEITDLERHIISQLSGNRGSATLSLNELISKFPSLGSYSELAYYVSRLQQKDFIEFNGDPFVKGGRMNSKFKNNVISIMFERVRITDKGIFYLDLI